MSLHQDLRAYGMRRHVARMFGVKLASDAFEKICEMRIRLPLIGARRLRVAQVHAGLNALSAAGKVTRKRSSFGVMLASKGHRKVLVDVYR